MAQQWNADGNYYYDDTKYDSSGNTLPAANDWGAWLKSNGIANAGGYNKLSQYMGDLSKNYGLGEQDFIKGFQGYGVNYQPEANDYAGTAKGFGNDKNMPWWGEDAMIRALGQGLDKTNPTAAYKGSWQGLWDQGRENSQQAEIGNSYDKMQSAYGKSSNFMNDLPTILSGMGLVLGAGALGGAFGGGGLFGGSNPFPTGGADWMSEIAAGAGNGGMGGVGNFVAPEALGGTGGGSGGGMDWLDNILGDTGSDWANGVSDLGGGSGNSAADSLINSINNGVTNEGAGSIGNMSNVTSNALTDVLKQMGMSPTQAAQAAAKMLAGGATGSTGTALSRLISGNATAADLTSLAGTGLTGALSALSADKYTDAMKAIADRSWNAGDPYRQRLEATYTNPGAYLDSPEVKAVTDRATNALSRSLSARDGNPIGSGRALTEINDYAGQTMLGQLNNQRNMLASYGGLPSISGAAIPTATNAAENSGNVYNSLANTVGRATQPQTDWQQIMKSFGFANSLQ